MRQLKDFAEEQLQKFTPSQSHMHPKVQSAHENQLIFEKL